jgi:hypothetical protein
MPLRRALAVTLASMTLVAACRRSTLPEALSDAAFWQLSEQLAEPAGTFALSDNYVSNERRFAESVRWLQVSGGVYVGVGPEQNFSYIAKLRPALAFVVDIRRENRALHLLYKALFELSSDRAEFASLLFSRPRPSGVTAGADVADIFARLASVPPSSEMRAGTAARVRERLTVAHRLPLSFDDLQSIEAALSAFMHDGPEIQFWRDRVPPGERAGPSYGELMLTADLSGERRAFLASRSAFETVKDLEARNLIVPVVGDFGGPHTIRAIGEYVRTHRASIRAFYGSNVAVYLSERQTRAFCDSLRTLPVAADAWFIESDSMRTFSAKLKGCPAAAPK